MSIATQITALQTDKTNIASAITTKGGTVTSGDGFDNFASDILTIPSGGGTDYMAKRIQNTLSSYTIPNTVEQIYDYSFYGQPITSITIPSSVNNIRPYAFYGCRIENLFIPNTVTQIGNYAFAANYGGNVSEPHLSSVTFDNNMNITLLQNCFSANYYMTTLVNFDINGIVKHSIPQSCFYQTALVGDISLGSSATVGQRGFDNNQSAGFLYIHLTQTDASVLTSKYVFGAGSTTSNRSFNFDHCRLVVPVGMLSDYQSAFPNYSSIMIEENQ